MKGLRYMNYINKILEKYGKPCVDALVESAMYHIRLLEKFDFFDI